MPQHDLVVDNGSGASVRNDINNALAALGSTMKGPNAPPAPIAGMMWLDDDTPSTSVWTLKIYDGADWISIATFDIPANTWMPSISLLRLAAGTAAAPSYSFEPDTDTGFYREGANSIGVAAGGKQIGAFQSNSWFMLGDSALNQSIFYLYNGGASASQQRLLDITSTNEGFQPIVTLRANINTDGSGNLEVFATPAGSRASDRRVNRMTIPGSGPINLAGDVDVSGNLRFNSGYGSAALAYGVRAWLNFNGTGTVAIRGSGGVTSVTDNGVGDYTVNYNFTMPDTNYAVVFGGTSANGRFTRVHESFPASKTTTAVRILHAASTADPADCADVNLAIVR